MPAGAPVYVRGMALTSIDVALALTEGRGGSFVPRDDGSARLTYVPAPGEAGTITALSRSGRPVLVKPDPARLATDPGLAAVVAEGRESLRAREGFDPARDIVPELCATATGLHGEVLAPDAGARRDPMPGPRILACWLEDLIAGATAARACDRGPAPLTLLAGRRGRAPSGRPLGARRGMARPLSGDRRARRPRRHRGRRLARLRGSRARDGADRLRAAAGQRGQADGADRRGQGRVR